MTQHASLTPERWAQFTVEQRVLMIGNEMQRATGFMGPGDDRTLRQTYERVLRLADLTIQTADRPAFRREMLRWRDLAAALYIAPEPDMRAHSEAFVALLRFTPGSARQIPYVTLVR